MDEFNKETINEENLAELSNDEIKEIIFKSNDRQLSFFYRIAQCNVIMAYSQLENLIQEENIYEYIKNQDEKEILSSSYNRLINSFNKNNLDMTEKEIDEKIKGLLEIRKELYSLFRAMEGYEIELSYMIELLNYQMMKLSGEREYKNVKVDYKEIEYIIDIIERELNNSIHQYDEFIEKVSKIVGIVPFRMSKFKYFNIIESTLKRNFAKYPLTYVETKIEDYKLNFDSSLMGDYGVLFDYCFAEIQKFKNINFKTKSSEELEKILDEMDILWTKILKIKTFIYVQGILSNKLIGMYLIKKKLNESLLNYSIFEEWLKYLEEPSEQLLEELLLKSKEELENIGSKFLEESAYLDKLSEKIDGRDEKIYEEIEDEMLSNLDIIKCIGDEDFVKYEVLFNKDSEIITEDYLEQIIDSLIRYINRSIVSMGNLERKIRMRRLLSYIDLPFESSEEFIEYVEYSLDERVVSREEILFTIDALNYIFSQTDEEGQ